MLCRFSKSCQRFKIVPRLEHNSQRCQICIRTTEQNKQLAFLDIGLSNSTGSIELSVHRKLKHTGLYNKFESLAPLKYKTNLIRNLLHRAYRICSNSRLLKNEIQAITHGGGRVVSASGLETSVSSSTPTSAIIYDAYTSIIKNLLKKNGYPGWIICNTTQKFLDKQRDIDKNPNKSDQSRKRSNKQIFVFFKLQYLHRISTQIEKEIRHFFKALQNKISNVTFYF